MTSMPRTVFGAVIGSSSMHLALLRVRVRVNVSVRVCWVQIQISFLYCHLVQSDQEECQSSLERHTDSGV